MIRPVSDPIGLEVRWDRLAAATDEAAPTMLRTAFSTIIRESTRATGTLQPEDPARVRIRRSAEMRYLGQGFEIEVDLTGGDLGPAGVGRIRTAFEATYRTVFGRSLDGAAEVVNRRLSMQLPDHDMATERKYARGEGGEPRCPPGPHPRTRAARSHGLEPPRAHARDRTGPAPPSSRNARRPALSGRNS
ncbi:hypothetical protein [Streptomyces swartbergensis]|uniref:hypothetical protein n=1 Tax=Streptomyces swartbergensis TaxID=487165 RepID=UPI00382EA3C8